MDEMRALRLMALLRAANSLDAMRAIAGAGLHKLKGARRHQWAITINGPWRICFVFKDGDAHDVEIVAYH